MTDSASLAFSIRRKTWFAMLSPLLVLIVVSVALWTFRSADRALTRVEHSENVVDAVSELEIAITSAESAARATIITRSEAAAEAFESWATKTEETIVRLNDLTRDNVEQQAHIAAIRDLADTRTRFQREAMRIGQENIDALRGTMTKTGFEQSRELRTRIRDIGEVERALMAARRSEYAGLIETARTILLIGILVALVLAVLANVSIRRDVADQDRNLRIITDQAQQLAGIAERLHENEQRLAARLEREQELTDTLASLNREGSKTIRELARSNQELDQFAYVASHDLRAPLRAISSLATWIEEELDTHASDETRENFQLLKGRILRMEALIDGILTYSRVGRGDLEVGEVDTRVLVEELGATVLARREGTPVELVGDFPILRTERVPLEQVFGNLISNALKYAPGGTVRVIAESHEHVPTFSVADDGPGIDPRFHERIFGFFQTLAPRDKVESTGIGLAVVKKLVEARGGEVTLTSEVGKGARFTFTWPAHAP